MHILDQVVEWLEIIVSIAASIVMVWGFAVSIVSFVKVSLGQTGKSRMMGLQVARCNLGMNLVFALELLIIADLLHTIVSRSMEDMIMVGLLVIIRTVIAFFLNKEIQDIGMELAQEEQD